MEFRLHIQVMLRYLRRYVRIVRQIARRSLKVLWHFLILFYELIHQVVRQAINNNIAASASVMAFNAMLSIFPTLLLVVAIISRMASSEPILTLMITTLQQVVPGDVAIVLNNRLEELSVVGEADRQVFSIGLITLLWVASAFLAPVIRALNNSYNVPMEVRRPWWLNRLLAIGIFIGTVGLLLSASILVLLGRDALNWGADQAGWNHMLVYFGQIMIWPLSMGSIVLALAFIYRMAPSQQPELAPLWPGACAGGIIWLVVSMFFRIYVITFGRYEAIYGSIGAVIVLLLWLYLSSFGILLGGEVNAAIHALRVRHRGAKPDSLTSPWPSRSPSQNLGDSCCHDPPSPSPKGNVSAADQTMAAMDPRSQH